VDPDVSVPLVGALEVVLGAGLLLGRWLPVWLAGVALQLSGTFLCVANPGAGWSDPRSPVDQDHLVLVGHGRDAGVKLRVDLDEILRPAPKDVAQRGQHVHVQPLRGAGDQPVDLLAEHQPRKQPNRWVTSTDDR
jgi:hypothetical protein